MDNPNYYEDIYLSIYYEMESFLVSLRSNIDILLHLVNFIYDLNIPNRDISLGTIYRNKNIPVELTNVFNRFTRPYNNPVWDFIYNARNTTVHEKSVNQVLPITIDAFDDNKMLIFFKWEDEDKNLITFFNQCLKFLNNFTNELFSAIKITI